MFRKGNPEVLVVGAGPVGLYTTLVLAKRGINVQVVDKDWRTGAHSYSLALHARSLRLLDEVGLLQDVLERAYRVHRVGFYDGADRRAELRLSSADDESFVAVLRQDALEHLLEEALRSAGVDVLWNHEVSRLSPKADNAAVTIDKLVKESGGYAVSHTEWVVAKSAQIDVPLVIGADGHRSSVRRMMGIDFAEVSPPLHFAVFEFKTNADLDHEMRVVLGERTTDAVWPLPDGYCRWSFQLEDYAAPKATRVKDRIALQLGTSQYPVLDEENLRTLLAERAPWFDGEIQEINWRLVVRFERRLASSFGSGRVWLAGDAGHTTGPVGMQSMNVGLREAHDLTAIITGVLRDGESVDRLQAYNQQRQTEWRQLLGVEGGFKAAEQADPWIRERSNRVPMCIPASGDKLGELAQQLGLELY